MRKKKYLHKFSIMTAVFLITLMAGGLWMNPAVAESNDTDSKDKEEALIKNYIVVSGEIYILP